jgi:GH35 family endo-1,4-beta-xylanase
MKVLPPHLLLGLALLLFDQPATADLQELIPPATTGNTTWRYTTETPGDDWGAPDFDDGAWAVGQAGFGVVDRVTPAAAIGTPWTTPDLWLRKTIDIPEPLEFTSAALIVRHDEDVEVYVGGISIFSAEGFNTEWVAYDLTAELKQALRSGENVVAVHVAQTSGGQYIDVGLVLDPVQELVAPTEPIDPATVQELRKARWSPQEAWNWYDEVGPIFGCNYLPRTAVNMTEMWQEETFDPETIDEELGWAERAGYNGLRVFVQYLVWQDDPEGLKRRMDRFLSIAEAHGMGVMFVPFCDCAFAGREPYLGEQDEPVPGVHNSGWVPSPGHGCVNDPSTWSELELYVKDLVGHFRDDGRVLIWDLYNEPGMSRQGVKSLPLVIAAFRWARAAQPTQPLTVGGYTNLEDSMSRTMMSLSDVVSFHGYDSPEGIARKIDLCRPYNRPILCTEWLVRGHDNRFETILPIFARERIGGYHWGLVAGRTQTYMPWGSKQGDPMPEEWHHDVFRADGTPYDTEEIELIRGFEFSDGSPPEDLEGEIHAVPAGDAVFSEDKDGVDFLFTIEHAPAATHLFYWARPFWVTNGQQEYGGYLGLQLFNDGRKKALFSFFGVGLGGLEGDLPGAQLNIEHQGFDGDPAGQGTQTVAPYSWVENHTYRFRLTSGIEGGMTYFRVHLKDLDTEEEGLLGAIQVENGDWKIRKKTAAFTEIAYGDSAHKYGWDWGDYCNTIPYSRAVLATRSLDGEVPRPVPGSYGGYRYCDVPVGAVGGVTIGVVSRARGDTLVHESGLHRKPSGADRAPRSSSEPAEEKLRTIVPTSQETAQPWLYTTDIPNYGWHLPEFDPSKPWRGIVWKEGPGGFGSGNTSGTNWDTQNIWLRRAFELESADLHHPHLRISHDEHAEVYLNGHLAAKVAGVSTGYQLVPVSRMAREALRPGTNVISVHCHQTTGGQYIDVGLIDVTSGDMSASTRSPAPIESPDPGISWPTERIQEWHEEHSPIVGCNYLPRTAINSVEMWRKETFDPETINEELGWAAAAGYNSVRIFLQYVVWADDPQGFAKRLETFLRIADEHGLTTMPIFFDDVCFAMKLEPILGPQDDPIFGIHNSGWVPSPGYSMVQDHRQWTPLESFVKDVVGRYGQDPRVIVWDIYNEPGPFFDRTSSFPLAKAAIGWVRELDPIQPVTIAVWGNPESRQFLALSDVLSLHTYSSGGLEEFFLEAREKFERPVLVTECLARPSFGFETMLPLFARHRAGWYNWGLVAGRTQTNRGYASRKGDPRPTLWPYDVLQTDGTPYAAEELELIRNFAFDDRAPGRWTTERAKEWYARQPWLVGCNFIPSSAINQLEMWQAETFDPVTIDRELGYAAGLGFNVVRVYLHDLAYEQDPEGFLRRIDRFLNIADSHGIKALLVIFDDCWLADPRAGEQPEPWPGIHNSGWLESPGLPQLERYPTDTALRRRLERYVEAVLTRFREDPRVLMWDLYNEPGGWWYRRGEKPGEFTKGLTGALCVPLLTDTYRWARSVDPSQPLTSCWNRGDFEVEAALQWADIVTFHHYGPPTSLEKLIAMLQEGAPDRPIICTEYLIRGHGDTFQKTLPVLSEHGIGAINWGLVTGKTNTVYGWSSWNTPGEPVPEVWHHDILHVDGTPFDQEEAVFLESITRRVRESMEDR